MLTRSNVKRGKVLRVYWHFGTVGKIPTHCRLMMLLLNVKLKKWNILDMDGHTWWLWMAVKIAAILQVAGSHISLGRLQDAPEQRKQHRIEEFF